MKFCPRCKKETDLVMTDCEWGRIGKPDSFDSGYRYFVRVHCNDCGVAFTLTVSHIVATKIDIQGEKVN